MDDNGVSTKKTILLVDGDCALCHWITGFVMRRDAAMQFRFAALQSPAGQRLLMRNHLPTEDMDTFVMIQDEAVFTKSDAALRVLRQLSGLWPLCYGAIVVPRPIRNLIYDRIARSRYRLFGRKEQCMLPAANDRSQIVLEEELDQ